MIAGNCFAHKVHVTTCNASSAGTYKDVTEVHFPNGIDIEALTCSEPGEKMCKWETPPKYTNMPIVQRYVEMQIDSGVVSGSMTFSDGASVVWNGTDITNYSYDLTY